MGETTRPTRIPGNEKALERLDTAIMFLHCSANEMIEGGVSDNDSWKSGLKTPSLRTIMSYSAVKMTSSSKVALGIDAPVGLLALLIIQY